MLTIHCSARRRFDQIFYGQLDDPAALPGNPRGGRRERRETEQPCSFLLG